MSLSIPGERNTPSVKEQFKSDLMQALELILHNPYLPDHNAPEYFGAPYHILQPLHVLVGFSDSQQGVAIGFNTMTTDIASIPDINTSTPNLPKSPVYGSKPPETRYLEVGTSWSFAKIIDGIVTHALSEAGQTHQKDQHIKFLQNLQSQVRGIANSTELP